MPSHQIAKVSFNAPQVIHIVIVHVCVYGNNRGAMQCQTLGTEPFMGCEDRVTQLYVN